MERHRSRWDYILRTWPTLTVSVRAWSLVGAAGGACLAAGGCAALLGDRMIALILLGASLAVLVLLAARALLGAVRGSR
jgi:hypothetical protein